LDTQEEQAMKISIHATLIAVILAFASVSSEAAGVSVTVVFSHDEAATIRAYYESTVSQTAHGKNHKGRKSLPPGIAKNLQRGKPLPPGIAKRALPQDLLVGLPTVRHGYERVIVDGKVLLVEVATQIIHDVLVDILIK
jgi:hypothetical protein